MKRSEKTGERRRSLSRRERHVLQMKILIGIILLLILVFGILLFARSHRRLDLTAPYAAAYRKEGSLSSDFSLQTQKPFAEDLVVSGSEDETDRLSLEDPDVKALLYNLETKEILYSKGTYDRIYPASITKIMTALIYLEKADPDAVVTMEESDFALEENAQASDLAVGDQITMDQLFHTLLVYSANDAAMAIARTICGSQAAFVDMMNEEAARLGMTGTHFSNCHGLHAEDHYTTAYDVYLMLNETRRYPEFSEVSQLGQYEVTARKQDGSETSFVLYATDEFLSGVYSLPENIKILASKTGTTSEAGACLSLLVQDDYGVPYAAIIMNDLTHDSLYRDMISLLKLVHEEKEPKK